MRLIAERLLPDATGSTFVDREIVNQKSRPLSAPSASFHLYCSELNPFAAEVSKEVSRERGLAVHFVSEANLNGATSNVLHVTTQAANLPKCDHMLLYLTGQTWTRGEASTKLGDELMKAMDLEVSILLVHEMPGAGGQEARFGCEFGSFFSCPDGATPGELIQRGIYSSIAVPLKGGAWREASMMLLGAALGMSKEEAKEAQRGAGLIDIEVGSRLFASMEKSISIGRVRRSLPRLSRIANRQGSVSRAIAVTSSTSATIEESAIETAPSSAAPVVADTIVATFGPGPFGMSLKSHSRSSVTKIGTVDDGSQAMEQGVEPTRVRGCQAARRRGRAAPDPCAREAVHGVSRELKSKLKSKHKAESAVPSDGVPRSCSPRHMNLDMEAAAGRQLPRVIYKTIGLTIHGRSVGTLRTRCKVREHPSFLCPAGSPPCDCERVHKPVGCACEGRSEGAASHATVPAVGPARSSTVESNHTASLRSPVVGRPG